MERLRKYLLGKTAFTNSEWKIIVSYFDRINLSKNEFPFTEKEKEYKVAFILEGVLRYYSINSDGKEATCYFARENSFVVNPTGFTAQSQPQLKLVTVTPCTLAMLSAEDEKMLAAIYPQWYLIFSDILFSVSIEFVSQKSMLSMNATRRYQYFMQNSPTLVQRVPLRYIASYLGIAQPSLSRLRRSFVKPEFKKAIAKEQEPL